MLFLVYEGTRYLYMISAAATVRTSSYNWLPNLASYCSSSIGGWHDRTTALLLIISELLKEVNQSVKLS